MFKPPLQDRVHFFAVEHWFGYEPLLTDQGGLFSVKLTRLTDVPFPGVQRAPAGVELVGVSTESWWGALRALHQRFPSAKPFPAKDPFANG
jgi:hypothetical protein